MIVKCTYPSGAKNANLRRFNHVCDVCGGEVSLTGNLGSGELWKDSKGELFLSIRRSNASTSLVAVSEDGYLIESSEITWPLLRCPVGTILQLTQKKDKDQENVE
jgi:hypothetical protein